DDDVKVVIDEAEEEDRGPDAPGEDTQRTSTLFFRREESEPAVGGPGEVGQGQGDSGSILGGYAMTSKESTAYRSIPPGFGLTSKESTAYRSIPPGFSLAS
ncbi:MAG: hypothetical protein GXP62_15240, partial [Oligoflexia bacterium]|nr:hypothetical protein [Oligoflexia bacterium]